MAIKKGNKKYLDHRKMCLKELVNLTYERNRISKRIREVRSELHNWDKWLLQ